MFSYSLVVVYPPLRGIGCSCDESSGAAGVVVGAAVVFVGGTLVRGGIDCTGKESRMWSLQ